ncbi:glycerophosphodiester phosphodiesterase [Staphylococcus sp. ACRSN]|uniref:glycerophosphodiester phosphodiesterase family protein n=1 Tax=Staphylococcus sp. ACRSN TaxID=2918214 RepID=UPI001EF36E65|nr:glycerophosphodiester phosphodiesterase family protein [Staphylococcus sp. ACRSN]MCG7338512.1 glycerophosphodiester phosphodiesterase [Staphylococcus sp. ACRSN]
MKKILIVLLFSIAFLYACNDNVLNKNYLNIAHRGASGSSPEHTFAAYDKAINKKADYIELDLQMTKDKKLIAMHDYKVDRTTNDTGYVKDKTLKQIESLDAGSYFGRKYRGEKVPELSEVLDKYYKKANFYIETKNPEMYPTMDERLFKELNKKVLLTNHKLKKGKIIIQSFSEKSLMNIHHINSNIPLIKLISDDDVNKLSDHELDRLSKNIYGIGINQNKVTKNMIKKAHKHGLKVHVFTLNSKKEVKNMKELNVDGGFINNP